MKNTETKRMVTVEVTLTKTYTATVECDAVNTIAALRRAVKAVNGNVRLDDGAYLRTWVQMERMTLINEGGKARVFA